MQSQQNEERTKNIFSIVVTITVTDTSSPKRQASYVAENRDLDKRKGEEGACLT